MWQSWSRCAAKSGSARADGVHARSAQIASCSFPTFLSLSRDHPAPPSILYYYVCSAYDEEIGNAIATMLCYTPNTRATPFDAIIHPLYDELRSESFTMEDGSAVPPLLNFTAFETKQITKARGKVAAREEAAAATAAAAEAEDAAADAAAGGGGAAADAAVAERTP